MTNITKTFISPIILTLSIIIFIILRVPSLSEPHWYGDEGVYAGVAYAMENGKVLYTQVWDNKPPGIYFLYMLGNPENGLLVIRILNILAGVISLAGIAALVNRLKFSKVAAYLTLLIVVYLLGTPLFEGNIANGENFFLPAVIWGLYFGLSKSLRDLLIAGVIFGLGFWIKFHPLFDMSALGLFIVLTQYQKTPRKMFESLLALAAGFMIPLSALLGYLQYHNSLEMGLRTIFLGNVQYTKIYQLPYLTQEIRIFFLLVAYTIAFQLYRTKKISKTALFILSIYFIEYFSALLSGRRYLHYLIAMIPSLSLLIGFTVSKFWEYKHLTRSRILIVVITLGLASGQYLFRQGEGYLLDTDPIKYYKKYYDFVSGKQEYFLKPIESDIADLNQKLTTRYAGDKVHLNIDNPWFYDQSGIVPTTSFIPAYHQGLRENGQRLYVKEVKAFDPTVIVVEKSSYKSDEFLQYLELNFEKDVEDEAFVYYVVKR
ncbi:glycosyltransferase family 39 protein [Candidatus Woesebacteria bacterium]|nr:glycosyltransferase family 39 protein [Candidatus Woesebacteria bacterium]